MRVFRSLFTLPRFNFVDRRFAPEGGRVTRGFDDIPERRIWQAEQILKSLEKWPPREGEIFVMQIDQDNPPPPPPLPRFTAQKTFAKFQEETEAWKKSVEGIQKFLTRYTGQTVVFRVERINGRLRLNELNPNGPFRSASHTGQMWGDVSCNDGICGMAWLRTGVYPYSIPQGGWVFSPLSDMLMSVARDINANGVIDGKESILSSKAYGFGIQIHPGFPNSPKSTGCQTFPPDDFAEMNKILLSSNAKTFSYVLVRRPNEKTGAYVW